MKVVYTSGRYTLGDININIKFARNVAIDLWQQGFAVICPHLNTANFENDCNCVYDEYIAGDLAILARCDAIVMIPGWEQSNGANIEYNFAIENNIPVYIYPELPHV